MVVKLQQNDNMEKIFRFKQNIVRIQNINTLRVISLFQETIRYPCFKPENSWNIKFFQKFEKFKFYPNITKTGVIKNVDHHPLNFRNYAAAHYQTLEEVPWHLLPRKIQKKKMKNCKYFKKLKFVILKS